MNMITDEQCLPDGGFIRLTILPTATGRDIWLAPLYPVKTVFISYGSMGGTSPGGVFQTSSEYATVMVKVLLITIT